MPNRNIFSKRSFGNGSELGNTPNDEYSMSAGTTRHGCPFVLFAGLLEAICLPVSPNIASTFDGFGRELSIRLALVAHPENQLGLLRVNWLRQKSIPVVGRPIGTRFAKGDSLKAANEQGD